MEETEKALEKTESTIPTAVGTRVEFTVTLTVAARGRPEDAEQLARGIAIAAQTLGVGHLVTAAKPG